MLRNLYHEEYNLNINSWLINWGLMNGYLDNGKIQTTKFGIVNQWLAIFLNLFAAIKWTILLFHSKDSKVTHLLGDIAMFFGPKAILDPILIFISIHLLTAISLFMICSLMKNTQTMFQWLESLKYDFVNRCFGKLNLNESDSEKLTKRIAISSLILRGYHSSFTVFYAVVISVYVYLFLREYYITYGIAILLIVPQFSFMAKQGFGLLIVLNLVNQTIN